ncbi:MAG: hypothetical protein P1P90_01265 [Patescibacteria group bacterium]|nr:hypothetical protein [Patescibacteria group bacterium]
MTDDKKTCGCNGPLAPQPFFNSSRDARTLTRLQELIGQIPEELTRKECLALIEDQKQQAVQRLREETEQKILQTFPNLICFADNPNECKEKRILKRFFSIRHNSVMVGELKRFRGMQKALKTAKDSVEKSLPKTEYRTAVAEAQDRALFDMYTDKYGLDRFGFEKSRALMRQAITNTRASLESILSEYFPPNRHYDLTFNDRVQTALTMPQLIELMSSKPGQGVFSSRIPFEARIVAVIAQLEFESLIGTHNPDALDQIRESLLDQLEKKVFQGAETTTVVVVAKLDPLNHYRVKQHTDGSYAIAWYYEDDPEAKQQTSETVFIQRLRVHIIKKNGNCILVHSKARRKERIFAKQLRKNQRKPEQVTDLSGLVMVLLNNNPINEECLANRLRATIVNCPGLVSAQQSNAKRAGAIDRDNPFSSDTRRGEKYEFLWSGIWHELQILALPDFINSLIAHAQDGHPFYKLITYLDTLFPWIWPAHIYRMDWFSQEIRDMLWRYKCSTLQPA